MSFFEPENLARACGGEWVQKPRGMEGRRVVGVGTDTREDLADRVFVALRGERFDGHDYLQQAANQGASLLIVDRDAPLPCGEIGGIRVDCTRSALGRLAASYRDHLADTTVIAITGSVGKTTTKQLIGEVLAITMRGTCARKSFNNDIGVPLTMLSASPGEDYLVVEIGMNAPGEIARLVQIARPDIAVIAHVGCGHLEGVGTIENVAREKLSLLEGLTPAGVAVINVDCAPIRSRLKALRAHRMITFGEAGDAAVRLVRRSAEDDGQQIETADGLHARLALPGRHNAVNALAAIAVGRVMGVPDADIAAALACIQAVPMRLTVEDLGGVRIINDCYNANPDSIIAALETFAELTSDAPRRIAVLGDMLELGQHAPELHGRAANHVIDTDRRARIEHVVLIGPNFRGAMDKLRARWDDDHLHWFADSGADAHYRLASIVQSGDAIVLKGSRGMQLERLLDALGSVDVRAQPAAIEVKTAPAALPAKVGGP